jgi:hypothetical protein
MFAPRLDRQTENIQPFFSRRNVYRARAVAQQSGLYVSNSQTVSLCIGCLRLMAATPMSTLAPPTWECVISLMRVSGIPVVPRSQIPWEWSEFRAEEAITRTRVSSWATWR